MARILFLTQVLPFPLYGGAKIRAYHMLRYLAETDEVTLVSFTRVDDEPEAVAHLAQFCQAVHCVPMDRSAAKDGMSLIQSVMQGMPSVILRDRLPGMEGVLAMLVGQAPFDFVHADQTSMAQYGLYARDVHPEDRRPAIVLDQHNALYLVVQRQSHYERSRLRQLLWRREAGLLEAYEAALLRDYDAVLTVTSEDKEALLRLLPDAEARETRERISVVPICVDPDEQAMIEHVDEGPRILHLGTMFWPPNVEGVLWFANEVLPFVLHAVPEATFIIAGKDPPPEVQALVESESPLKDHIEVTGFVPDPTSLLGNSRVFVVPLLAGGGMRVKILDAWMWGLPMVSTTIGAEGIMMKSGENLLLADEPQDFAAAVVRLLEDQLLAERLRENGRAWVEMHYDWQKVYQRVNAVYDKI